MFKVFSGFVCVYIFLQTFAIPGSIFLSIISGFLFPFPLALFAVCFCSATGEKKWTETETILEKKSCSCCCVVCKTNSPRIWLNFNSANSFEWSTKNLLKIFNFWICRCLLLLSALLPCWQKASSSLSARESSPVVSEGWQVNTNFWLVDTHQC